MNDLTSTILQRQFSYNISEFAKQASNVVFADGTEQRISTRSSPAIRLDVQYMNISDTVFGQLRTAFEANHTRTFQLQISTPIDSRVLVGTAANNSTWAFIDWEFEASADKPNRYNGKISCMSSALFNYASFQALYTESSAYTANTTTNTDFETVLTTARPYRVKHSYILNGLKNNVGASLSGQKDKLNAKRSWELSWHLSEAEFVALQTFYRKKGAILGTFGMPSKGYYNVGDTLIKARFLSDTLDYNKDVQGRYFVTAQVVEVKSE